MAGLNIGELSHALARPGIDPRVWIDLGVVTARGFDPDHGPFVDLELVPSGDVETAMVGTTYAGRAYGAWFPLEVGDLVVVAIPRGDTGAGPVVITRVWRAADPPPSEVGAGEDLSDDVVLRVREGKRYVLRTSGSGGSVDVAVEGDGAINLVARGSGRITIQQAGSADIVLKVASGKLCYVGDDAGAEPIALGTTLKGWMDSLTTWLTAHTHGNGNAGSPTTPPVAPPPSAPDVRAQKGRTR